MGYCTILARDHVNLRKTTLNRSKRVKKKRKTVSQKLDEVAVLVQKLVRLKAADYTGYCSCVTCGVSRHWSEMQGGHFISRKSTATKIMEENIHPQCAGCNGPKRGNLIQYTLFMQDTYGRGFVEELENLKRQTKKYTREEIYGLKEYYTNLINEIRQEKGL